MRIAEKSPENKKTEGRKKKESQALPAPKRRYTRPSERGLGPNGMGWNVSQASAASGLSAAFLRDLIKRKEAGEAVSIFPYFRSGRRVIVPRAGFRAWFEQGSWSALKTRTPSTAT